MQSSPFRQRLEQEFKVRREKNARYSLRAFAAPLGTDHSTLSQILRAGRRVPGRQLLDFLSAPLASRDEAGMNKSEICAMP
ncbi:MAG TPA: hypothetical protein VI488_05250 [Candidatus Angelobacter sp.]